MDIFERIKQRRKQLNLSQEQLANRLGLTSRAAVSAVEKGKCDMTTDRIRRYSKALNTSPAYLMGWQSDPDAKPTLQDNIMFSFEADREKGKISVAYDSKIDEYSDKIASLSEDDQKSVFKYIDFLIEKGGDQS